MAQTHSGERAMARTYDWRWEYNKGFRSSPSRAHQDAIKAFKESGGEVLAVFDPYLGVTRSLYHVNGYLTDVSFDRSSLRIGMDFVANHLSVFGLKEQDLAHFEETNHVPSAVTGATHVYLRQQHEGIPVYNGMLHFNVNREGRLISVNNGFVADLANSINTTTPKLQPESAVSQAALHLGVVNGARPIRLGETGRVVQVSAAGLSLQEINAELVWVPVRVGDVRLAWNFQIWTLDDKHAFDFTVDATSGQVLTRFDWVAAADYTVYPRPIESPNHTAPVPPADARQMVLDPQDPDASPFGWHDTDGVAGAEFTILRGNNAHAYLDLFNNSSPPVVEPDGGPGLSFDFPMDLSLDPDTYEDAAVTNLFYWNNTLHDILWHYGFDEPGGNFQANNYGRGGLEGDYVRAEAQDGREIGNANNAFFLTPPDGINGRMEMYVFTITTPRRDGDFDQGIIAHEFGHGISNRLIGGPSNVGCLSNVQRPGEGISDFFSLIFTHPPGADGTDVRGSGTYVLGQATNGPGIRDQPYSTDPGVNNYTYESIIGAQPPYSTGSVWTQAAWEVYWALVDHHGFDADLYNVMGGSGNQRMMLYIVEGMKNTICSPAFTDMRDGIIQAATDNYGGEDVCRIWEAFAAFGLGVDAISSGPNGLTPTNGFSIPEACNCAPPAPPENLVAASIPGQVSLTWTGTGPFHVERSLDGCTGSFVEVASNLANPSYTDESVTPGMDYSYRIRAAGTGNSCFSDPGDCMSIVACGPVLELAPHWGTTLNMLDLVRCL